MEGEEDILKYLNLDPDHHEKIAALIPKVGEQQCFEGPCIMIRIWNRIQGVKN